MQLHLNISGFVPHKQCRRCKQEFPATTEYFHRHKRQSDGLYYYCKECNCKHVKAWADANREYKRQRDREYYASNPERHKRYGRRWRKANPERRRKTDQRWRDMNREKLRRQSREWERANPESVRRSSRKKYKRHKDKITERNRRWAMSNPGKRRAIWARRRARKRNLPDNFTAEDWQHALDYFGGCCAACERPMNGLFHAAHTDHWVPLSSKKCPGTVPANMVPLCGGMDGCNQSKGNKSPKRWLTSKFGKRKAATILSRVEAYFETVRQI